MTEKTSLSSEWYIGRRLADGTVSIAPKQYASREEAEEWFEYLCGPWRDELREKMEQEDLRRTNWAHRTWDEKKDTTALLLERQVSPYALVREEASLASIQETESA